MNCHGGNNQGQNNHEKGTKGHGLHMLLMVLCCAIPIVLLLLLPVLRINNAGLKKILPFAVLLLCPLMHMLMIPMMLLKGKGKKDQMHNPYKSQEGQHIHTTQIEDRKGEI